MADDVSDDLKLVKKDETQTAIILAYRQGQKEGLDLCGQLIELIAQLNDRLELLTARVEKLEGK